MIKLVGIRNEDLEPFYSIPKAAQFFEVHPNTVRTWIKKGELAAAKIGGESRISKETILSLMEKWRDSMAMKAKLTINQMNSAMGIIPSLLGVNQRELEEALEELWDCHHISSRFDPQQEERILLVNGREQPSNPTAKSLKRMLGHSQGRNHCPHCDKKLPRWVRAASQPPPAQTWKLYAIEKLPGSPDIALVGESHWCSECQQTAKFISVSRKMKGNP